MPNPLQYSLQKCAAIFEGSPVDKGCVPVGLLLIVFSQYYVWGLYTLARPDRDQLINVAFIEYLVVIYFVFLVGAALLLGVGLVLRKRAPNALLYQHVTANYYGLTLVFGGYCTGGLSLAAGVVLLGGTLMGIVLLHRQVVAIAFGVSFSALFVANLASAYAWIPYAPALVVPQNQAGALFWTNSSLFFALPNIATIITVVAIMLLRWRKREADILALSLTDPLTQTHNRRSILQLLEQEVARSQRHGGPLSLAMVDLDHFKRVNDTWGHLVGDRVLLEAADALHSAIKDCDAIGRFGGEEFLILLPNTHTDEAVEVLEQCRQRLAQIAIRTETGEKVTISASFGVVCNEFTLEMDSNILLRAADDALYRAKHEGRNQVVLAPPSALWQLVKDDAALANAEPRNTRSSTGKPGHRPVFWRFSRLSQTTESGTKHPVWTLPYWQQQIAEVLEWSPVAKSILILCWVLVALVGYSGWLYFLLHQSNLATIINSQIGFKLQWSNSALITLTVVLLVFGFSLLERAPRSKLYQHITLQFYGLSLLYITYVCGILSMPTGLMLITAPLLGLILFEPVLVWWSFASLCAIVIILAYASAFQLIPYAPLLADNLERYSVHTPFWLLSTYLFLLLTLAVVLILADHLLRQWREREAHVQRLSRTDALTNVHNRRSILNLLAKEVARTLRHGPPLAVVLLDLDYFKRINDTWGHPAGDTVLREAATVLSQTIRQCDAVGRYGGEEFLLVLADTSLEGAKALVERCRVRLAETKIKTDNGDYFSFSASFGIASNEQCFDLTSSSLIKAADAALYRAKASGRNRVEAVAVPAVH